jgi:hypothetical protein
VKIKHKDTEVPGAKTRGFVAAFVASEPEIARRLNSADNAAGTAPNKRLPAGPKSGSFGTGVREEGRGPLDSPEGESD